jgi:membrane protein YqaA with SNARE-associated domain
MDFAFSAEAGLAGLFVASFLSATLLPGGSEAVLAAVVLAHPGQAASALLLATLGNTLGGMTTFGMGRLIPAGVGTDETPAQQGGRAKYALLAAADGETATPGAPAVRHLATLHRWGAPALLLAWTPIVGDALCAAAGWLRLPWLPCLVWMALGKGARYGVLLSGMAAF